MPPAHCLGAVSIDSLLHDVRTPLTVIQGRLQLLDRFLATHPQPAQVRLLHELTLMQGQVTRIAHRLDVAQGVEDDPRS